jgi:hypothetical protein
MKIMRRISVVGLAFAALMLGSTDSLSQEACDTGGNHTIQVTSGADGKPAFSYRGGSAENVHVCIGDQVMWVLTGSDREFFVDFFSGAPFAGPGRRNSSAGTISVVIGGDAQRGQGYAYMSNWVGGGAGMDPQIIVD